MAKEYIEREAFLEQKREQYCKDCARRKGLRNGKYKTLYEIGEAPCSACGINDVLNDVEDFPAAYVRPVVHAHWVNVRQEGVCSWTAECSNCWTRNDIPPVVSAHYCPSCGAVMDEEVDDG